MAVRGQGVIDKVHILALDQFLIVRHDGGDAVLLGIGFRLVTIA